MDTLDVDASLFESEEEVFEEVEQDDEDQSFDIESEEMTENPEEIDGNADSFHYNLVAGEDTVINEIEDQIYVYQAIKDPMGEKTNYFTCHYKKDDENYITSGTCISKKYKPISMQQIIDSVKSELNVVDESVNTSPFLISWVGKCVNKLNLYDNYGDTIIYKLMLGEDYNESLTTIDNNLSLSIINTYNATSSIFFDFVISIDFNDGTKNNKFNDYFTLHKINLKNFHKGTLQNIKDIDISGMSQTLNNNKKILCDYMPKNIDEIADKIASKLRGKIKKDFIINWTEFPKPNKNMFNLLLISSMVLTNNYTTKLHFDLRKIVESHTSKLFKSQQKIKKTK